MTYQELIDNLSQSLTPEQLTQNVTILYEDEYLPINHIGVAVDDDILDTDHIVLMNLADMC